MGLFQRIEVVSEDAVERHLAFTSVVALAGVIKELDLPMQVGMIRNQTAIELLCEEDHWWLIEDKKEQVRAALLRRGLDIMFVRKMMRFVYATTIEEP